MALAFNHISLWLWGGGKIHDPIAAASSSSPTSSSSSPSSAMSSSFDFGLGFREPESIKFLSTKREGMRSRRIKKKWHSREERKIDKEYDLVLVPSDGVCLSGSESDDSDWSIGWMEPHAPDFLNDNDNENFAVIVQCYARGHSEQSGSFDGGGGKHNDISGTIDMSDGYSNGELVV